MERQDVAGAAGEEPRLPEGENPLGLEVVNREGQELGEVTEVVRDAAGRITFALLASGGLPDGDVRLTPLPWRMLAWHEHRRVLVADLSPEHLLAGPHFYRARRADVPARVWQAEVLRYYGYAEETAPSAARPGPRAEARDTAPVGPHGFDELPDSGATAEEEEGRTAEAESLLPGGPGEARRPLAEEQGERPESEEEPLGAGVPPGPLSSEEEEAADRERQRRAA